MTYQHESECDKPCSTCQTGRCIYLDIACNHRCGTCHRKCAVCGAPGATHPLPRTPEYIRACEEYAASFKDAEGQPLSHTGHPTFLELPLL